MRHAAATTILAIAVAGCVAPAPIPPPPVAKPSSPIFQKPRPDVVAACVAEQRAAEPKFAGGDNNPLAAIYQGMEAAKKTPGPECARATPQERLEAALEQSRYVSAAIRDREKVLAAEREKRQAAAKPAAERALLEWSACVRGAALRLSGSPEPADTVVRGAFGLCASEERQYRERSTEAEGRPAASIVDAVKIELTPRYIGLVLAARAAATSQQERGVSLPSAPTARDM